MKRFITLAWLALALHSASHAQSSLIESPQRSRSVAVYRLSGDDVRKIYIDDRKPTRQMMRDCTGIYADCGSIPQLDRGNYLVVESHGGKLKYTCRTVDNFHARLVRGSGVQLLLTDTLGGIITDASVKAGSRKLRYDPVTRTYNTSELKDESIVEIDNRGVMHYLEIDRQSLYPIYRSRRGDKAAGSFKRIFGGKPAEDNHSFIVLNKPRYKPGDTVRFKAYMAPGSRPFKSELEVHIDIDGKDTMLMNVAPYRDGFYEGAFALDKGLGLRLGRWYTMTLRDSRIKVWESVPLRYEEYQLTAIDFDAKTERERYTKGEEVGIVLSAHDENDLPLYDAEVEITMRSSGSIADCHGTLFVPDTMWHYRRPMNGRRMQRIVIPDSVFIDGVSMRCNLLCIMTDATGEQHRMHCGFTTDRRQTVIDISVKRGIMTLRELIDGRSVGSRALLTAENEDCEVIFRDSVTMPYTAPIDCMAAKYRIESDSAGEEFFTQDYAAEMLSCDILRDTAGNGARIRVDNPSGMPFWYTVRRDRRIIDHGYATRLDTLYDDGKLRPYSLRVAYLAGDEAYSLHRELSVEQKSLSLAVTTPDRVYPGQRAEVEVEVTDRRGRPVKGADITAYAYTAKFDMAATYIPRYDKILRARPLDESLYDLYDLDGRTMYAPLDYALWRDRLGLDSVEFYRFLYPDPIYTHTAASRDSITTLMPYAVVEGALQGIHLLWLDGRLCYWHQGGSSSPILRVRPGRHRLRMLTSERIVEIDSIDVARGMKNIISADVRQSSGRVNVIMRQAKQTGTLSDDEYEELQRHVISIEPHFGDAVLTGSDSRITLMPMPAAILSGDAIYRLEADNTASRTYRRPCTAGVVPYSVGEIDDDGISSLMADTAHIADFKVEGGYRYDIRPGYLSRTSWRESPVSRTIAPYSPATSFRREADTRQSLHDDFTERIKQRIASRSGRISRRDTIEGECRLNILIRDRDNDTRRSQRLVTALFDDCGLHSIYYGNTRSIADLSAGRYTVAVIMCDSTSLHGSIDIRSGGDNYLQLDARLIAQPDSLALTALYRLGKMISVRLPESYALQRRPHAADTTYVAAPSDAGIYSADNDRNKIVTGTVTDQSDGMPLIGAIVRTDSGSTASTDIDGRFRLPYKGDKLITVSYIGYEPYTVRLRSGYDYRIVLQPNTDMLEDVVITAYGSTRRSAMTGSVAVNSKAADMLEGSVNGIQIRGRTATTDRPTIVVDGEIWEGELSDIDPSLIIGMESIGDDSDNGLYGSTSSRKTIVITTAGGALHPEHIAEEEFAEGWRKAGSIRHDFRDDAFWQPRIVTGDDGRARFHVTYPDNITAWNANFIAVGGRRLTAQQQRIIRSTTPVNARLSLPEFAIHGDSITAVGRLTNYLTDTVELWRTIVVDKADSSRITLADSHIDRIPVIAPSADSLQISYSLRTDDGYCDGERRSIPLLRQGIEASYGQTFILDDTLPRTFTPDPSLGAVSIHAQTSGIDRLSDEIDRIARYRYSCNEQTASKLKAQLARRKISLARGQKFDGDRDIKRLIEQLTDPRRRTADRLWSWWSGGSYTPWITLHAVEALTEAQNAGYKAAIDRRRMAETLRLHLDRIIEGVAPHDVDRSAKAMIHTLMTLHILDPQIDCRPYIDAIASIGDQSAGTWIRYRQAAMELCRIPVDRNALLARAQRSFDGGLHWGDDVAHRRWCTPDDDETLTTLAAYRLLRETGGSDDELAAVRIWLCQRLSESAWVNTYLSSCIIETILPDMLTAENSRGTAAAEIDGRRYDSFPVHLELDPAKPVTVSGNGSSPIFITLYQSGWEQNPQPRSEGFTVESQLFAGGVPADTLEKGSAAELRVNIGSEADARYVMIEIPVPAGCSCLSKNSRSNPHQIWRENFKERVVVFCDRLPQGSHTFTIELLPRYTGRYRINPARASLMYYPTVFGRNTMTDCTIDERNPDSGITPDNQDTI